MRLTGEDVASAVRDWIKQDMKNGPSSRHDLGKFFFTVSTTTLTVVVGLLKFALGEQSPLSPVTACAIGALFLSMCVALYMVLPLALDVTSDLDLYAEYNKIVRSVTTLTTAWFVIWLIGFSLIVVVLLNAPPDARNS